MSKRFNCRKCCCYPYGLVVCKLEQGDYGRLNCEMQLYLLVKHDMNAQDRAHTHIHLCVNLGTWSATSHMPKPSRAMPNTCNHQIIYLDTSQHHHSVWAALAHERNWFTHFSHLHVNRSVLHFVMFSSTWTRSAGESSQSKCPSAFICSNFARL